MAVSNTTAGVSTGTVKLVLIAAAAFLVTAIVLFGWSYQAHADFLDRGADLAKLLARFDLVKVGGAP